jgi:hypothetical protein
MVPPRGCSNGGAAAAFSARRYAAACPLDHDTKLSDGLTLGFSPYNSHVLPRLRNIDP